MPFLLRYVLGEFHYGQRATRKLPGQQLAGGNANNANGSAANGGVKFNDNNANLSDTNGSTGSGSKLNAPPRTDGKQEPDPSEHELTVSKAFDVLANE